MAAFVNGSAAGGLAAAAATAEVEEEEGGSDGSGEEEEAAASATQQEYAKLLAGLVSKPETNFASASFNLLEALRQEQQQLLRQQQQLGGLQLQTQWLPLVRELQQLQQEKQQQQEQHEPQQQQQLDRLLFMRRCLQALQEDAAAWAAETQTVSRDDDREINTSALLQQLARGQLFHTSGRPFTAIDAEEEVWTSSDEDGEEQQQQQQGANSSSSRAGTLFSDEQLRFPAAVLPLRAALRGVRKQQRDALEANQLLLQLCQPNSTLEELQQLASAWGEDGLWSAARLATQQQLPLQQQKQHQREKQQKKERRQKEKEESLMRTDDDLHAVEELQRVEELGEAKRARRELRAWKTAARDVFGTNVYEGLEQILQTEAALAAASRPRRGERVMPAACALLADGHEQQQLLRLLLLQTSCPTPQQQQLFEDQRRTTTLSGEEKKDKKKKRKADVDERGEERLELQQQQLSFPPTCFFSHGLHEMRCSSCRVWLTQTQQLLQLRQEGCCSLLLQPVQTRLVQQLLLLQQQQRGLHHGRPALPSLTTGAADPGRTAAGAEMHKVKEEEEEEFEIVAAPDLGTSPYAEKLYVGHLGMLYTTVWGGGYSCGPHTLELLLWLGLLQQRFQPLQLRSRAHPRSRERHAQRWQLLREASSRGGMTLRQQQRFPSYLVAFKNPFEEKQQQQATSAAALSSKSLFSRAMQKQDKMLLETDADSSASESEQRYVDGLLSISSLRQQQRPAGSSEASGRAVGSCSFPSSRVCHAREEEEDEANTFTKEASAAAVETAAALEIAAAAPGGHLKEEEEEIPEDEEDTSEAESIDLSNYLTYIGKGFVHVNQAWMHKPLKRRRRPLSWTAGDDAQTCGKTRKKRSAAPRAAGPTPRNKSRGTHVEAAAAAAQPADKGVRLQRGLTEKADVPSQQPEENEEFPWTLEVSSSEDSVDAYKEGAGRYRRRFRVWRRRQRELQRRRVRQQQQHVSGGRALNASSLRAAGKAAGSADEAARRAAAAAAAAGDPGAVDQSRQGHILEDFLKRLGGISYSRYSQLAATAAAGAAAATAFARRKVLGGGRVKRRRGESSSSKSESLSLVQRAAALQLRQLQPRKVWGWHWDAEKEEEEQSGDEGRNRLGFMRMLNFKKKLYRMRRKPRVRSAEPSWDLQLQQLIREKKETKQEFPQQRKQQQQETWQGQEEKEQQRSFVTEDATDTSSPRVFPFGMATTGWWGPPNTSSKVGSGAATAKGREVQFICVDDRELHTRMGKTKLYQERFEGLEDELASRREYYAVIDEVTRRISIVPAGRLSFFLTETPRQIHKDFLEQLFGDLRRNAGGSLLQTLLLKRRSARNVLLMNAMLWQSQLKYMNQARLCRLLGGFWRDAAFAAGDAPLTEQQLLEDFLSVSAHALHLLETDTGAAGSVEDDSSSGAAATQRRRWRRAAAALEDRWRRTLTGDEEDLDGNDALNAAEAPVVDAAAARMGVPRMALRLIDQAATDAASVAALAAAAADRKSQREACRNLLPRLLLRYIHHVFPAFVHVYLTSRCAFAVQKAEEILFLRRVRQVESVGLVGVSQSGSFTGEVLRGQYERTAAPSAAMKLTSTTKEEDTNLGVLKKMLPPFNDKASTPAELFKLDDVIPMRLLQDANLEDFSGDPFVPLVKGGRSAEAVNIAALKERWGRFAVDLAYHIGQGRQSLHVTMPDDTAGEMILRRLSLEELARLVKILKGLAALFSKQRKIFAGEKELRRFFEYTIKSDTDGDSDAVSERKDTSTALSESIIRWIMKTFLRKDGSGRYVMSPEHQTKLLTTLIWVCAALSPKWTFDFEALLKDEWRGRYDLNFEACAALVGLRRLRTKARSREYRLELPAALTQPERYATSRLTPMLPKLAREKGRRSAR